MHGVAVEAWHGAAHVHMLRSMQLCVTWNEPCHAIRFYGIALHVFMCRSLCGICVCVCVHAVHMYMVAEVMEGPAVMGLYLWACINGPAFMGLQLWKGLQSIRVHMRLRRAQPISCNGTSRICLSH